MAKTTNVPFFCGQFFAVSDGIEFFDVRSCRISLTNLVSTGIIAQAEYFPSEVSRGGSTNVKGKREAGTKKAGRWIQAINQLL
jgi:hypothetical protein